MAKGLLVAQSLVPYGLTETNKYWGQNNYPLNSLTYNQNTD